MGRGSDAGRQEYAALVMTPVPRMRVVPMTADRWDDLVALFGPRGACAGCWCMWWRLPRAEWESGKGAGNRRALKRLVASGVPTGVLAYAGDRAVGWCAVAPRRDYVRLSKARTLAPVDEAPVWAITCFFVARDHRGRGLMRRLIAAAVEYAAARGAAEVEAYPVDSDAEMGDAFVYTGTLGPFVAEGFREVARRSRTRPIVRCATRPKVPDT